MRRRALTVLGLIALLAVPPTGALALDGDDWKSFLPPNALLPFQVREIRAATYPHHDPGQAETAGYAPASACVPGRGVPYVKSIAEGQDDLAVAEPNVLVYAPLTGGGEELVAVGYASKTPASLFGREFDPPSDAVPYHTLRAWVWKVNPAGLLNATNPRVSCDG
ncbi:hypothetical protein [Streptomyces sp. NBC_01803]|uniref:hypothetical protein n=1 Tax=Streptomyces sp. NBC_01803 TaxID=2975946 RepID=UPI002DDC183C|nr:hypothetical protein [Streptomyces sp. NBC_01803]WSA45423.1 hypothetical protein OIE51_15145 [Streptomyces sp. NBC_01803]